MKRYSIKLIGLAIIYILFMLGIAFYSAMKNKETIMDKSNIAFITAIEKERKSFISNLNIKYDSKHSPNSISAGEIIDWTSQAFLTIKDSCRHRLDSIFREEIINYGLDLGSSISCTYNGKTTNSVEAKITKGIKIIHEKIYRTDYKKENDIILRAYIYLPLHVLIGNTTLYILMVLGIVGLAIFVVINRKKQIIVAFTETRTADNTKWIIINNDIFWDEKNCILKRGEKAIILRGESLKFFRLFIKNESFLLRYKDMYKSYGLKDETPEFKDRIYHSIKELKKDLTDFDINIKSVRGIGYRLTFH